MEAMGLEPMTFRVWGERSSQLSYASMWIIISLLRKNARERSGFGCLMYRDVYGLYWMKFSDGDEFAVKLC